MNAPSSKEIADGLRRWRMKHGWTQGEVAKRSQGKKDAGQESGAKRRKNKAKAKFSANDVGAWETGKKAFSYERLVSAILPAYDIHDFDLFLDYCQPLSLNQVKVIGTEADDWSSTTITGDVGVTGGVGTIKHASKDHYRTRIDLVSLKPGEGRPTKWAPHAGHEFVFVVSGKVKCFFAVERDDKPDEYVLNEGMAIAFPSGLYHKFENTSKLDQAVLVAAKPGEATTAMKQY